MQIHLCGSTLHGPNVFRLCNQQNRRLITANEISSHPVWRGRQTSPHSKNKNHIRNLSKFIAEKLKNSPSEDTARKLNGLAARIINMRNTAYRKFNANYAREEANYKAALVSQQALINNLRRQGRLAEVSQANAVKKGMTKLFINRQINHIQHLRQITYWKWIRNSVLPEVKIRLRKFRAANN